MTIYNLDKGTNNDIEGRVLYNWLHDNDENIHNLIIKDTGMATIENMANMFFGDPASMEGPGPMIVKSVDLSNMNTSNVTNMARMFQRCTNLINISNFNTSNVTDMSHMFGGSNLTNVPNFDTAKVTNMNGMFEGSSKITNISNFNTSNVTDMSYTFFGCGNLTNVPNFDTAKVTNMNSIFSLCYNLIDIPEFNTANVTNISSMIGSCNNISNAGIQNIINMCLNSNIPSSMKNLHTDDEYSPFFRTKFNNSYYSNRLSELSTAGWSY